MARLSLDRQAIADARSYMGFDGGEAIAGMRVDVAFIGSCTNSRLSDLREAARIVRGHRVASHVKALVVPGSVSVKTRGGAAKGWTKFSARRASSGEGPVARCAWA